MHESKSRLYMNDSYNHRQLVRRDMRGGCWMNINNWDEDEAMF